MAGHDSTLTALQINAGFGFLPQPLPEAIGAKFCLAALQGAQELAGEVPAEACLKLAGGEANSLVQPPPLPEGTFWLSRRVGRLGKGKFLRGGSGANATKPRLRGRDARQTCAG